MLPYKNIWLNRFLFKITGVQNKPHANWDHPHSSSNFIFSPLSSAVELKKDTWTFNLTQSCSFTYYCPEQNGYIKKIVTIGKSIINSVSSLYLGNKVTKVVIYLSCSWISIFNSYHWNLGIVFCFLCYRKQRRLCFFFNGFNNLFGFLY